LRILEGQGPGFLPFSVPVAIYGINKNRYCPVPTSSAC